MADSNVHKTLEAKCHCGSVHFTIDVPISLLPAKTHLCHCSLCRYATGAPCVVHTPFDASIQPQWVGSSSPTNMTYYTLPPTGSYVFCSTCGCHIGAHDDSDKSWVFSTSIFTESGPTVFNFKRHIFSKSAKGGGLCNFLTHLNGTKLDEWNPPDDSPSAKLVESAPETAADGTERLRAQCHCGGVSFAIKRPDPQLSQPDSFFSTYVPPDPQKWAALWDVCHDCRLVNGVHVVGWTFVPASSCEPRISTDLAIGSSRVYTSSKGTTRSFCGTCGATIFFSCEARHVSANEHIVDVATGILRAPEGVMAEDWLYWRTKAAWAADGEQYDAAFTNELKRGLKRWTTEQYGQEWNGSIG